ncbi:MAG: hypothetical protein AAF152_13445 [Cyanobacteria bacterium P01_A01_bin.114]
MDMHPDSVQLFQMLIQAGAKPGEDFSCDSSTQTIRMNEHSFVRLQMAFPEIDWHATAQMVERDLQTPANQLETALGVPFIDQMLSLIERRAQQLPPDEAAWYMQQVMGGVERRTGISLYHYLHQQAPLPVRVQIDKLLDEKMSNPCNEWIGDLILAAGGDPSDFEIEADEVLLSEGGMALFEQVWAGDYELYETEEDNFPQSA